MRNSIKIHPGLNDEQRIMVKKVAASKGLLEIRSDKSYRLYKLGDRAAGGALIKLEERQYRAHGEVLLLGLNLQVWLYVRGLRDWFKTSPIISCTKDKSKFIIETMNSFYELEEEK